MKFWWYQKSFLMSCNVVTDEILVVSEVILMSSNVVTDEILVASEVILM